VVQLDFGGCHPPGVALQACPSAISDMIRAQSHNVCPQLVPLLGYNGHAMHQKLANTVAEDRSSGD
jgi:hypothetical protein